MKFLAHVGTFTLGAFAGGTLLFSLICYGLDRRTEHLIDNSALIYEDEDIRIVRCSENKPNDVVGIATITYKNRL